MLVPDVSKDRTAFICEGQEVKKKMLDGYKNTSSWTACPLKMWQRRSFETSGTTYPQAEGCGNLINQNLWRSLKTVEVGPVSWHITVPCQHVTPGYTLAQFRGTSQCHVSTSLQATRWPRTYSDYSTRLTKLRYTTSFKHHSTGSSWNGMAFMHSLYLDQTDSRLSVTQTHVT